MKEKVGTEKEGDKEECESIDRFSPGENRVSNPIFIFSAFNSNQFFYANEDVWEVITPTSEMNGQV